MSSFTTLELPIVDDDSIKLDFTPRTLVNGLATWRMDTPVYDAGAQVTMSFQNATQAGVVRVKQKVVVPVMKTIDGVDKKVGEVILNIDAAISKQSSENDRTSARNIARGLLEDVVSVKGLDKYEGIFGG